jgi:hypothetical protein
MLVIR